MMNDHLLKGLQIVLFMGCSGNEGQEAKRDGTDRRTSANWESPVGFGRKLDVEGVWNR